VGNGNLAWAVDGEGSSAFSSTSVLSPWDGDSSGAIEGEDHIGEDHGSVRELVTSGDGVSFEGNVDPVEVTFSISDVQDGRFSVPRRSDDPVSARGLDCSLESVTSAESLEGGAFLLLAGRAAIPAGEAPAAEAVTPGQDRLQDSGSNTGLAVVLGSDEIEENLSSVGGGIRRNKIVSSKGVNLLSRRRIPAAVI